MGSRALELLDSRATNAGSAVASRTDPGARTVGELPPEALGARGVDGAYVHVPFCFHKCHYCDFYSFVDHDHRQPAFVCRLIAEWESAAARWTRPLQTIFVGGGTPTLLAEPLWRDLLRARRELLPLVPGGEFTVEANPETVTPELAETLVEGGVTRVSIGCQSFDPRHLKTLERWHDPASVARSVATLRRAGIAELNVDLIFGIPGQTVEQWRRDLQLALDLGIDHLSAYDLTYEPNTAMTHRLRAGEFAPCDERDEAAMYEAAMDTLAAAGFEHYEISNWARRDALGARRCRHNVLYWQNRDWWAFGPSGSAHVQGVRWKNVARLGDWLASGPGATAPTVPQTAPQTVPQTVPQPGAQTLEGTAPDGGACLGSSAEAGAWGAAARGAAAWGSPVVDVEQVDERTRSGERLMMGLRLIDGLSEPDVLALISVGDDTASRGAALRRHEDAGLLERRAGRVRLTRRGLLLANSVVVDLI